MKPMLFGSRTTAELPDLAADEQVVLEQKLDGVRCMIDLNPGGCTFIGAGGEPIRFAAAAQWFATLERQLGCHDPQREDYALVLDGELMIEDGRYIVFDMPYSRIAQTVIVTPEDDLRVRRKALEAMRPWLESLDSFGLIRQAASAEDKIALVEQVTASGGEGFMLKRLDSPYQPGRRVEHSVKVKFVHTADVVILHWQRGKGTGSAELGCYDSEGQMVRVGGCSLIGKPEVVAGDVVEVAFSNWSGAAMIQPRMVRVREDKKPEACTMAQFRPYSRAVV